MFFANMAYCITKLSYRISKMYVRIALEFLVIVLFKFKLYLFFFFFFFYCTSWCVCVGGIGNLKKKTRIFITFNNKLGLFHKK